MNINEYYRTGFGEYFRSSGRVSENRNLPYFLGENVSNFCHMITTKHQTITIFKFKIPLMRVHRTILRFILTISIRPTVWRLWTVKWKILPTYLFLEFIGLLQFSCFPGVLYRQNLTLIRISVRNYRTIGRIDIVYIGMLYVRRTHISGILNLLKSS